MLPHFSRCAIAVLLILGWAPAVRAGHRSGVLAEGSRWQTPYHIHDAEKAGPTLLIVGGVHGNEPAGYRAAEQIRHWPIVKGRLIVIPMANRPGLRQNVRRLPDVPDGWKDLNRNFPRNGEKPEARGEPARAIWDFLSRQEPDWVLDLHEGYDFHVSHKPPEGRKKSVGSSVIYFGSDALDPLVGRMLDTVNGTVTNANRRFVALRGGPVGGSLVRACIRHLGARGMILETTYRDQPMSRRTRQHRLMVAVVMRHLGMVDGGEGRPTLDAGSDIGDVITSPRPGQRVVVGLYDGGGTGAAGVHQLTRILDAVPDMGVHHLGPPDLRPDLLSQLDVVLFPGGSGSRQAKAIGETGRESVRRFVRRGGGYLGVCAGAYLCSAHYAWSLDLIDTRVFTGVREVEGVGRKAMWYRGKKARVEMQLTEAGRELFGDLPEHLSVDYANGPIVSPKLDPALGRYTVLAHFRSEVVLYPPQRGTMVDTPAIVGGAFGRGRVLSVSPHPESTDGLRSMVPAAVRWLARQRASDN